MLGVEAAPASYIGVDVLDALPAHVAVLNREGAIVLVNEAWKRFARANGLAGSDYGVGSNYLELCESAARRGAAEAGSVARALRSVLERARSRPDIVYPCHAPDNRRWFRFLAAPWRDGAVVLHIDVTAQMLAEEALSQSEAKFRVLAETSPCAIAICRSNCFCYVNPALEALTGYSSEELLAMEASDLFPCDPVGPSMEWRLRTKAGEERWLALSTAHIELEGTPATVWTAFDVTNSRHATEALQASEERYRELFENANDIVYVHDLEGRFTALNRAGELITGYTREEAAQMQVSQVVAPEFLRVAEEMVAHQIAGAGPTTYQLEIVAKDGRRVPLEVSPRLVLRNGRPVGVQGIARDVTDRRRAEQAMRESEERYALAMQGASDGLWDWNLRTGQVYYSPRWKAMLGYGENGLRDSPEEWLDRIHPEDRESFDAALAEHLAGSTEHFEAEHRVRHRAGSYRWMLARGRAIRNAEGKPVRLAGSQTDITLKKLQEERLRFDALHDELTALPNRALLMDRLNQAAARLRRHPERQFAVIFLDVDRFKIINDSLGHCIGDELLIAIARRLERCLRPTDTVARLGGDEFVILLDELSDLRDAARLATRIQHDLSLPFNLSGQEVFTTVSIGIAASSSGFRRPEDLLRNADTALYRAKSRGRARHVVFHSRMHARAVARLKLETDLRRALERGEFRIYYQAIVSGRTGEVSGVEALLRWQHPDRGLIAPAQFIPVAEETGIIASIGQWVLEAACEQGVRWNQAGLGSLRMAVNLSAHQFHQPNLRETVARALQRTGLDPGLLELELTESVVLNSAQSTVAALRRLHEMGVRISIDDFGTGYSSLGYLSRFPIRTLKIARPFVQGIASGPDSGAIVRAIITLGHNLKLNVVAEGVERPEQLEFLRSEGCDEVQGYLFGAPMPPERLTRMLERRQEGAGRGSVVRFPRVVGM
jgi:diguanylate cyclase (GGDEF)-like protein/PAS domain S-box-containing protein